MATNAYDTYLENKILTADPLELVEMLYRAAREAIQRARTELRHGRIRERSRAITRASDILNELALAVDHGAGGQLSRDLVELYAYLQQLLIEANSRQQDAPLEEAERLVASLAGAWRSCRSKSSPAAAADDAGTRAEYRPISCTC